MQLSEKIKFGGRELAALRYAVKAFVVIAVSFALSFSSFAGAPSPLAAAFAGALDIPFGLFAFIGTMAGSLLSGSVADASGQIASILLILAFKVIIGEIIGLSLKSNFKPILCGICTSVACAATAFASSKGVGGAVFGLLSGVICAGAVYFFPELAENISRRNCIPTSDSGGRAAAVTYILAVSALCASSADFFNLGRIISVTVILFAARRFFVSGAAVRARRSLSGMLLVNSELAGRSAPIACAALFAGVVSTFGTIPAALFFFACTAAAAALFGLSADTARLLVDTAVGTALFVIIPDKAVSTLLGGAGKSTSSQNRLAALAASKLEFAAKTIGEIKADVEEVSKRLKKGERDICACVCDEVCAGCPANLICWEKDFDGAYERFESVREKTAHKGYVAAEDVSDVLGKCLRKERVADSFTKHYIRIRREENAARKVGEMRSVLYEQLSSTEELLCEISAEISDGRVCDSELSAEVREILVDLGAERPNVCVLYDNAGRMSAEAFFTCRKPLNAKVFSSVLADLTEREFAEPHIFCAGEFAKLCVSQKEKFRVDYAIHNQPKQGNTVSGDCAEYFCDGAGNAYFLISDGMGSGSSAALDSLLSASLLTRFLKAGTGCDAAVRLINTAMQVKSPNESFATLDILCVNLFSGETEFIKLGAPPSCVLSDGKLRTVEIHTFPVGIIGIRELTRKRLSLSDGDVIVMTSDGADSCAVRSASILCFGKSAAETADVISSAASNDDDTSVICVKILKNV